MNSVSISEQALSTSRRLPTSVNSQLAIQPMAGTAFHIRHVLASDNLFIAFLLSQLFFFKLTSTSEWVGISDSAMNWVWNESFNSQILNSFKSSFEGGLCDFGVCGFIHCLADKVASFHQLVEIHTLAREREDTEWDGRLEWKRKEMKQILFLTSNCLTD